MSNPIIATAPSAFARGPEPQRLTSSDSLAGIRHRLLIGAASDSFAVASHLDATRNGIVLLGKSESKMLRKLRQTYPDLPILVDRAPYDSATATADAPFPLPERTDQLLPTPTLRDIVDGQLAQGATLAVLAMAYLAAEDPEPLRAAIAQIKAEDISNAILMVPADFSWLKRANRKQFIAILKTSPIPVAIGLNHRGNALRDPDCLAGFRELFEQVPDAMPWRIDHNGLGAMALGAPAAVIGVLASHRHVSVQGEFSRTPHDKHPNVWVATLMMWGKASELRRNYFATTDAPGCASAPCSGDSPVRFTDSAADIAAGNMHNVLAFLDEHRSMPTDPDLARDWWRTRIRSAVDATAAFGMRAQRPGLKPPADVHNWFNELH